jgi:hypothetical protein
MKLLTASVSPFLLLSPIHCLLARSPLAFVATRNAIEHAKFHASSNSMAESESKHVKTILFVECGSFHACNGVVWCDQTIVVVDRPTHSLPVFGSLYQPTCNLQALAPTRTAKTPRKLQVRIIDVYGAWC